MNYDKVIIIAEAGVNHNGDIEMAKRLIDGAAEAQVDYVKFQTWITEELVDINAPKAEYQINNDGDKTSQFEMLKQLELPFSAFIELKKYAEKVGVKFLSTPDDYQSLDFLADELDLSILKVSSGEVTNIPFLRRIGKKKKDIIMSTGMATIGEVETAYKTLLKSGAKSVAILHCTSNYPASYESVNLKAMNTLRQAFNTTIGYSDHTIGNEVSVAAVALGAKIIEKHYTLDKTLPGPDHTASIDVEELKDLVKQIRNVEQSIAGDGTKQPHSSEAATRKIFVKGIYLTKNVEEGVVITDDLLVMRRPATNLNADMYDFVVGKKLSRKLAKGKALQVSDLVFD